VLWMMMEWEGRSGVSEVLEGKGLATELSEDTVLRPKSWACLLPCARLFQ